MEIIILKHISYEKGIKNISFFTKEIGKKLKIINDLSFLEKSGSTKIISFNYYDIIDDIPFRDDIFFYDIEKIKRQLIGRSKIEYEQVKKPWIIWNMIADLNPSDLGFESNEFKLTIENAKAIFFGLRDNKKIISDSYQFILECIEKIYHDINDELSISIEKERFEKIELKLNNILFETSKRGIRINTSILKSHIEQINIELYEVKNRLQLEYGIFSLYDYQNIQRCLVKEFSWFKDIKINSKEFWKIIKLKRYNSNLVELLYSEKKLMINKTILTRIGSTDYELMHPDYDYFGTITGRILVNSPSIQQLNKKYRDIIIPNSNMELVYIDYSQFEAGILAYEANDEKLIEMYNTNDIYTEISNKLGSTSVSRELAKKLFFSYCYGMSKENIVKYSGKNIDLFFKEFPGLETFESDITQKFESEGFVETSLGNRRYKSIDNIENKKEGWLISQKIQGLASLILKEVIIDIHNKNKEIKFLLPMHDAVLYEVPKNKIKSLTKEIEKSFVNVLKNYCPSLNPKISNKPFYEK